MTGSTARVRGRRHVNEMAWDVRTPVHLSSAFYADGRKQGSTLHAIEIALVGDVTERRLLHLQCHFGQDTGSWARLGANVTGVDFSGVAIAAARERARDQGLDVTFVHADVQALPASLSGIFDLVVSTYGVMCWLDDLAAWAAGIRRVLVPGGRFILVDFHPMLEVHHAGSISGEGSYFGDPDPHPAWTTGTYADRDADISYQEYRWQHPIGDVVNSLLREGLTLKSFTEYPGAPYPLFAELDVLTDGLWTPSDGARIPYIYSIVTEHSG